MTVKIPYMVNEVVGGGRLSNINGDAPDFAPLVAGFGALGDAGNEYFAKLQDERNVATAKEIDAKLSMAVDFRSNEASSKLGKESIGVTKASGDELDIDIASIAEEYKDNAWAQTYLSNQSKGASAHLFGTVLKHETSQVMVQSQQASEQQINVETSRVVSDSLNSGSWDEGISRNSDNVRKAVSEYARVKGIDENMALGAVTTDMFTAFAVSAEPEAVLASADSASVKGVMDEKVRQQIIAKAKDDKAYLDATNMGGELYLSGASETDALKKAREAFPKDPRAQSVVMGGFAQAVTAQRRVEAEGEISMRETINTKLSNGEPLTPTEDAFIRKETGRDPNKMVATDPTVADYNYINTAQVELTRKLMTAKTEGDRTILVNAYQAKIAKNVNPALHQTASSQGAQILEKSRQPQSGVSFNETSNRIASQLNAQGFGLGTTTQKDKLNAQADIITVMLNQRVDGYMPDGTPNPTAVLQSYKQVQNVKKGQAPERIKEEIAKGERNFKMMMSLGVDMGDTGYRLTPLQQWLEAKGGRDKDGAILTASDNLRIVLGHRPTPEQVYDYLRRAKIIKE